MEAHLKKNDKQLFYKYLDKSNIYFEYGCGGSTYQAGMRKNIKKIYSVESDIEWQKELKNKIKHPNVTFIYNEMDTQPNSWGNPGRNATQQQKKKYSNRMNELTNSSNKIAFIQGSSTPYDENITGFGGTQMCVLNIASKFVKKYDVYIVHDKREKEFVGKSGIKYVKNINETLFKVIIDVRHVRNTFLNNVKYIHWIHDPYIYNNHKLDLRLNKYDNVISLTEIQKMLWDKTIDTRNFKIINNPFILEPIQKTKQYNKFKIVAFSSKTNWEKCIKIVERLRTFDNRFKLHCCSPSYSDISKKLKKYDFVVNHGFLSHYNMMKLLSDAFVCLYPCNFQENCPGICYECMYYGVPILTEFVKGSGLNDIIPTNLIFPQGSDMSLYIDKILDWYKNDTRPKLVWNERNDEIYQQWNDLIDNEKTKDIDLVFIDGRFRVACCLKCYDIIKDSCRIVFDDFLNRPQYHIVLDYFDIVEKTQDNIMVILKKKKNINIPKEIIDKYELIHN